VFPFSVSEDVKPPMNLAWRQHAACRGVDADIFYPVSDEEADAAKAICAQCAVPD
jgi:hypothetical protein